MLHLSLSQKLKKTVSLQACNKFMALYKGRVKKKYDIHHRRGDYPHFFQRMPNKILQNFSYVFQDILVENISLFWDQIYSQTPLSGIQKWLVVFHILNFFQDDILLTLTPPP